MKKINWDEWQQEILEATGNICLCTGRQVGKTSVFAMKAIKRMLEKETHIIVVSLTEDQAQLIISMALNFLEQENKREILTGSDRPTKNQIKLRNGSVILARPVGLTGDSVRGFTGDILIIDEASRMGEAVFSAAKPTLLTTAGEIWLCSTPFGKQGYFWECFNNEKRFKIFHISSVDVIKNRPLSESWTARQRDEGIEYLANEERDMGKVRFGQEYLGLFMDELAQWFPDELILKCMNRKRPESIDKQDTYLGVDIGRMGEDLSTFAIVKYHHNKIKQVEHQVTKKTLLSDTTRHIINLNSLYNFNNIFIDDEGIGVGVFDHLLDNSDIKRKLVSINNSKRIVDYKEDKRERIFKEVLYTNLLRLMETGDIAFLDDPEIFNSLKSVQYEYTVDAHGKPHLKIFGNYTHTAEALVRCAWCVKYKPLNIWVKSI